VGVELALIRSAMLVCAIALLLQMYARESFPGIAPTAAGKDGDSWAVATEF
jgi:hypothetical protein